MAKVLIALLLSVKWIFGAPISASQYGNVTTAAGYQAILRLTNIRGARSLLFDDQGDLVILARGLNGIISAWSSESDSMNRAVLVNDASLGLNHGLALHNGHIYASSDVSVYRWRYSPRKNLGAAQIVISGIGGGGSGGAPLGHATRTLVFSSDDYLYVSVGSNLNLDPGPDNRSLVRRVLISNTTSIPAGGYSFDSLQLWASGLRNGVAMAFDASNTLWEADNGPDQLQRADLGVDIFNDNPAEELNRLDTQGAFYGYPYCWSAWNVTDIARGRQFSWPSTTLDKVVDDNWCLDAANNVPPAGLIEPHASPIGSTFFSNKHGCGSTPNSLPCSNVGDLFIALHGSWNSNIPKGFKVIRVKMVNGMPTETTTILSATDYTDICFGNYAVKNCFRPAGIAFDRNGTLWVSSDSTGDIVQVSAKL